MCIRDRRATFSGCTADVVCVKTFAFSVTAKNSGSTATDPGVTQTFNLVFDDDWAGKQADLPSPVSFKIG